MDLLSVHDIPEPSPVSTPSAPGSQQSPDGEPASHSNLATPTLDQEFADLKKTLGGVGASLGGWWGKVQKQSASALSASGLSAQIDTARKDLASLNLLEKARKEATRLGEQAREGYASVREELEKGPDNAQGEQGGAIIGVDGSVIPALTEKEDKGKGKAVEQEPSSPKEPSSPVPTSAPFTTLLTRIARDNPKLSSQFTSFQSRLASLPQNVQSSVQTTLANQNLADVQKLAEGYLAKGEGYLQGVGKELRELVNDAVKVVPPADAPAGVDVNAARKEERRRKAQEALAASGGRREMLIGKLRRGPGVLLVDPAGEAAFEAWEKQVQESGGIAGEAWGKRRREELEGREGEDGEEAAALKATFDSIVPASFSEDVFWTRFFFRVHQIDEEEARRRVVLGATQQADEDFTWDLEDESVASEAGADSTPLTGSTAPAPDRKASLATLKPVATKSQTRDSNTPLSPTGSADDDWGLSDPSAPASPTASRPPAPAAPATTATSNAATTSPQSGRNSSEEGSGGGTVASSVAGTTSSFDVVSAQPSGDEGIKASAKAAQDDGEESDWE